MKAAIRNAIAAQDAAAKPGVSAFVAANAGSGKTHVLINRVIRLLLAGAAHGGARPQNILCITYTKAAAAEMLNRLFDRLGKYSVMDDGALARALHTLDPDMAGNASNLRRARALFAQALETPGGLKVRTIHSFCESVLRRFPAEAGISPGFTVLDDRLRAALVKDVASAIGLEALQAPGGDLAQAIAQAATVSTDALDELYRFAAAKGRAIAAMIAREGGLDGALALSARHLGVAPDASPAGEAAALWRALDPAVLKRMAQALQQGSANDQKCAAALLGALAATDPEQAIDRLAGGVLTQEGLPRKQLPTKPLKNRHPWLAEQIAALQDQVLDAMARKQAAAVMQNSRAALVLVQAFHDRYCRAKAARGLLDFDDLIEKTAALLSDSEAAGWVLYKLDYDIEHILVDESQDNSGLQWQLVRALAQEFFAGKGRTGDTGGRMARTLFAVGDTKQSIYSFNGADPAQFSEQAEYYESLCADRPERFARPELALSWRSCANILDMVDETFCPRASKAVPGAPETKFLDETRAQETAAPGFSPYVRHQAQREDSPGSVELWAAVPRPSEPPPEDPGAPVDAPSPLSARNRLARNIADAIADWLARGELVSARSGNGWRQRPMRPGDIMILVRRRTGGLFDEIIRQLKIRNIPVAGADRMVLRGQTAVLDLMSAARMALLEEDDLALAEFLKGPFLHPIACETPPIDEDALYDLAAGRPRGQSLWAALQQNREARFDEARALVAHLRQQARTATPFGFFAGLLGRPSASGESHASRLYARLGPEAVDPVREFLGKALALESEQAPALAAFTAGQMDDETQIKRDMQDQEDAVRVMTVHAAKGLEAPVVILPDTTSGPGGGPRGSGLLTGADGALYWSPQKKTDPDVCAAIRAAQDQRAAQEHQRLLYVAMTRAQDRLVICGAKQGTASARNNYEGEIKDGSWYQLCETAFARLQERGAVQAFETSAGGPAKRFGPAPACADAADAAAAAGAAKPAPPWLHQPLPPEEQPLRTVAPSRWLEDSNDEVAVLSPLADGGARRFRRGALIHTLLQTLPDLPEMERAAAAQQFLEMQKDLDEAQIADIAEAVFAVLNNPDFAPLFGPASRAEVALSGHAVLAGERVRVSGQVDRLVVTDQEVLVVDYKSNRPAPDSAEATAPAYLRQMAAYRELLRALWPERRVRTALLWTDGPVLMALADSLLDDALQKAQTLTKCPAVTS